MHVAERVRVGADNVIGVVDAVDECCGRARNVDGRPLAARKVVGEPVAAAWGRNVADDDPVVIDPASGGKTAKRIVEG